MPFAKSVLKATLMVTSGLKSCLRSLASGSLTAVAIKQLTREMEKKWPVASVGIPFCRAIFVAWTWIFKLIAAFVETISQILLLP